MEREARFSEASGGQLLGVGFLAALNLVMERTRSSSCFSGKGAGAVDARRLREEKEVVGGNSSRWS